MRIEINQNGGLTLIAETETEHYTLKKWMDDFNAGKVTLGVKASYPAHQNASTLIQDFQGTRQEVSE